jgi:hypothetical protein
MPWVIKDYTSSTLDLENPEATFRDLSKPIGAQDPRQAAKFQEARRTQSAPRVCTARTPTHALQTLSWRRRVAQRYDSYEDAGMGSKPFHYGSHYSSAGIVLHYLLRIEPFTSEHIGLQGGRFDVADRLFNSVGEQWRTCLSNMSDVKELIPEFFTNPEFLRNSSQLPLGTMQSGHALGDVVLPPWADSPEEFVRKHREALESDYVSANLHHWINLVFGCKQRGPAAAEALNVFYYLTYSIGCRCTSAPPYRTRSCSSARRPRSCSRGRTRRGGHARPSRRRVRCLSARRRCARTARTW